VVPISLSVVAYIFVGLVGAVLGAGLYEVFRRRSALARRAEAEDQSAQIVQSAQREAENLVKEAKLEAKDLVFQARIELEKEQKAKLAEVSNSERRVSQREEGLDRKLGLLEKRDQEALKREQDLLKREEALVQKDAACTHGSCTTAESIRRALKRSSKR
jgi:ribonuclease Y